MKARLATFSQQQYFRHFVSRLTFYLWMENWNPPTLSPLLWQSREEAERVEEEGSYQTCRTERHSINRRDKALVHSYDVWEKEE